MAEFFVSTVPYFTIVTPMVAGSLDSVRFPVICDPDYETTFCEWVTLEPDAGKA